MSVAGYLANGEMSGVERLALHPEECGTFGEVFGIPLPGRLTQREIRHRDREPDMYGSVADYDAVLAWRCGLVVAYVKKIEAQQK